MDSRRDPLHGRSGSSQVILGQRLLLKFKYVRTRAAQTVGVTTGPHEKLDYRFSISKALTYRDLHIKVEYFTRCCQQHVKITLRSNIQVLY